MNIFITLSLLKSENIFEFFKKTQSLYEKINMFCLKREKTVFAESYFYKFIHVIKDTNYFLKTPNNMKHV